MDSVKIRPFKEADLVQAMRLKEEADWNQTRKDWQRLIDLGPEGNFVASFQEKVIGTVTTIIYERRLAWIGMMLVEASQRRRGIGAGLMRTALDYLHGLGVASVKLYATPAGRPLYESLGFREEGRIERWQGRASAMRKNELIRMDPKAVPRITAMDCRAFGADRSTLIARLTMDCPIDPLITIDSKGKPAGYALSRPGSKADYIGPIGAENSEIALVLLDGLLGQLNGKTVYLDFNPGCGIAREALVQRGLVKQRDLTQMAFGRESGAGVSKWVLGIAGPELG
ncbi:MAG TPA: GNAT family N-acetyltransferase [Thermodesulfobacteriota bacterium]|nr:GNAT family N-acetyltransferase [Thermodesulfobacteriota bacterium]